VFSRTSLSRRPTIKSPPGCNIPTPNARFVASGAATDRGCCRNSAGYSSPRMHQLPPQRWLKTVCVATCGDSCFRESDSPYRAPRNQCSGKSSAVAGAGLPSEGLLKYCGRAFSHSTMLRPEGSYATRPARTVIRAIICTSAFSLARPEST
jgi:hypothetical protein